MVEKREKEIEKLEKELEKAMTGRRSAESEIRRLRDHGANIDDTNSQIAELESEKNRLQENGPKYSPNFDPTPY